MQQKYHRLITITALEDKFSPPALEAIIEGNLGQDRVSGQIGHPEFHFDDSAFIQGAAYIEKQRQIIRGAPGAPANSRAAWLAFGRLTHAAQDFYAHSNYAALWLERYPAGQAPPPKSIQPLEPALLEDPRLRSGRIYLVELLTYISFLAPLLRRYIPRDAHYWLNLDRPGCGLLFPYAYAAALKRTVIEYHSIAAALDANALGHFTGQPRNLVVPLPPAPPPFAGEGGIGGMGLKEF